MRAVLLIMVAFAGLSGTGSLVQEPRRDKEKIQGTWKFVAFKALGAAELLPPEILTTAKIVIMADKMAWDVGKEDTEMKYMIDPTKKPKTIDLFADLVLKDGKVVDKGRVLPGIYSLENDELKLCWDANGKSRPTEFTTKGKDQDLRLLILKRQKKQ